VPNTIKDVATMANVSLSTVSRVLNNKSGCIEQFAPQTVKRVKEAAEKLQYRPSRRARGLTLGRNHCVTFLTERDNFWSSPFDCQIAIRAAHEMRKADYSIDIMTVADLKGIDQLPQTSDGIVFAIEVSDRIIARVQELELPLVWLNMGFAMETDCVLPDDWNGARRLGEHLLAIGCENVIFVAPFVGKTLHGSVKIRKEAFDSVLAGAAALHCVPYEWNALMQAMARVKSGQLPNAAVAAYAESELLAAMLAASESGLRIPDDLALVSCDVSEMCQHPGLGRTVTGVRFSIPELGSAAARMILQKIKTGQRNAPSVLIPEYFVQGDTTRS